MSLIVGFTGSSQHVTTAQIAALGALLDGMMPVEAGHHGDCVEADAVFDAACEERGIARHAHPGMDSRGRSPARAHRKAEVIYTPLPYLERNRIIVNEADVLLVMPDGYQEQRRSGTWSTVRRARERGIPIVIIWPNGRAERE